MGDLKRICHWGPLIALVIIKCISLTTIYTTSMWWPYNSSIFGLANHIFFMIMVGVTLYNFFVAMFCGPGLVPLNWRPTNPKDIGKLQACLICNGYKPPRAHHCSKCDRCVLKMDHHCPWINNCCGHRNHKHFIYFLAAAVLGAIHSTTLLSISVYRAYYFAWYYYHDDRSQLVYLTFTSLLFSIFSIGLAIGVILAVGGLLFVQMKIVLRNKTSIEDWIVIKALVRQRNDVFTYPYDLGFWNNFKNVFIDLLGDGINWNVVDRCNQYTLTVEQLKQKEEKKRRSACYKVIAEYNGRWFPVISQGIKVCLKFPCSDEPRIALTVDEMVIVTRWKKHWFYGEKVKDNRQMDGHVKREKGWFPCRCVVEAVIPETNTNCNINSYLQSKNMGNNKKLK